MSIKKELQQIIKASLEKNNIDFSLEKIVIETPKNEQNGDYSTNIALVLAKIIRDNPMNIAKKINESLDTNILKKVEIATPGFINFTIKESLHILSCISTDFLKHATAFTYYYSLMSIFFAINRCFNVNNVTAFP